MPLESASERASKPSLVSTNHLTKLVLTVQGGMLKVASVQPKEARLARSDARRGKVYGQSPKSRKRLLERVATISTARLMVFITLTYGENDPNAELAKQHLHTFLQRLYRKAPRAAIIWKMEYQQRGAIHFHLLCFNLPYIDKGSIQQAWGEITNQDRPFTRIEAIRSRKKALSYVAKYMAKRPTQSSGFNYVPYPNVPVLWSGRTWGTRGACHIPYATKTVIKLGFGRKNKEKSRWVGVAYALLRQRAAKIYPPIAFYEEIGFTVLTEHSDSIIEDLTYVFSLC